MDKDIIFFYCNFSKIYVIVYVKLFKDRQGLVNFIKYVFL